MVEPPKVWFSREGIPFSSTQMSATSSVTPLPATAPKVAAASPIFDVGTVAW